MTGFIRASSRFLRDRRILLGSFVTLLLAAISLVAVFALTVDYPKDVLLRGFYLVLAGLFWPSTWGSIVASILPKDERRQGTLEMLMVAPFTPPRLALALSVAPLFITAILFAAIFPGVYLCLASFQSPGALLHTLGIFAVCLLFSGIQQVESVWRTVIPLKPKERELEQKISGIYAVIITVIFPICLMLNNDPEKIVFLNIIIIIPVCPLVITGAVLFFRESSLSIEEDEAKADSIGQKIGGLLASLRSRQGTIFEREEGVSKYETLERIRQQTLGGPLLEQQTYRDVIMTILFLLTPIVLIVFFLHPVSILPAFRIVYGLLILLAMFFSAANAAREMLQERSSLRLETIRTTLLPLSEVTRVKEWIAKLLPFTLIKWITIFGFVWTIASEFSIRSFIVSLFFITQGGLALSLSARLGLRLGLSARDEYESVLWIGLLFFFWTIAPFLVAVVLPHYLTLPTAIAAFIPLAAISPAYSIYSAPAQILQWPDAFILLAGLGLQALIWRALDRNNQQTIRAAW